ncbi:hypothetical protein GW17_00002519 [Ensete ventricosum]|nr:hypothetical protein GW17_00002519 [Ensete ventricosum]
MQRIPGTITPSPNIPPREGMRWRVIVGKERSERKNRQDRDHLATKYNQNQRKNGMTKIECRSTKVFGPHHCYPLPPSSCKQMSIDQVGSASGTTEEANLRRPQVVNPSGSPEVAVGSLSSGGMTPGDAKAYRALSIMRWSHDCDSTITVQHFVEKMKSGSLSRSASQPSQQPKEKIHAASVEKPPVEKTTAALTEKSPTKGGTIVEKRVVDLEAEVKQLKAVLGSAEQEVKYPDVTVVEDPFTDRPKDANIEIENSQPFDDNIYPED